MSRLDASSIELYLTGIARHANPYRDGDTGVLFLSLPERLPQQERDDTMIHICKGGETIYSLAVAYYGRVLPDPLVMAVPLANFQSPPIVDMSVPLDPNRVVLIPSAAYKQEVFDGGSRTLTPMM